jgi:predicted ATPase
MFRRLMMTNFKAWARAELEFGRITGVFGVNSSGKTSLLQFILMLKQTKDAADRALTLELGGPHVSLGSYRDLVYQHDRAADLSWSLEWEQADEIVAVDPSRRGSRPFARGNVVEINSTIFALRDAPRARSLTYRFAEHSFQLVPRRSDPTAFDLRADGGFELRRTQGRAWPLPGPVKAYGFPDQAQTYFQNSSFLALFVAAFEAQMDRVFYLGPLREYPKREYPWTRSRPSDVGQRGERVIEAILAATENAEVRNLGPRKRNMPFQEMIAYWLKEMGLVERFSVEEIKEGSGLFQAKVRVRRGSPEVLLTEVGFGVSQVLPVLTLLYYVAEGSTVILEQPEIHLHPSAQAALADVIVAAAQRRKVQVIVESHSEHFLLRLQRRVAEGLVEPSDIKLYFCDVTQGSSRLVPLELDIFGTIANWPRDFFGDAFGDTAAAEIVRLERRAKAS